MLILSSVALQKNIIYFKLLAFLLGIPKLYTAGLLLCLLRIKIKVFSLRQSLRVLRVLNLCLCMGKVLKKKKIYMFMLKLEQKAKVAWALLYSIEKN